MFDSYFEMQGVAFTIFGHFYSSSFNIVTSRLHISSFIRLVFRPQALPEAVWTYKFLFCRCFENRIRRGQIISAACQKKLKACHRLALASGLI